MLKLFNYLIELFKEDSISSLSLGISLATFLFTYFSNGFHLKVKLIPNKIKVDDLDDNGEYNYSIRCQIENKSKIPITIINAKLNNYKAFRFEVPVCGNGIIKFGKQFDDIQSSFNFPFKLESYDAKIGILLFCSNYIIKFSKFNLLTIYTTRGKYYRIIRNPLR